MTAVRYANKFLKRINSGYSICVYTPCQLWGNFFQQMMIQCLSVIQNNSEFYIAKNFVYFDCLAHKQVQIKSNMSLKDINVT